MKKSIYLLLILCTVSFARLNSQNIVGTIPGSINIDGSGAATYTIPIEYPVGINGMQPNIQLTYNSQSGDGPVGVGWGISGLSSIIRKEKNIFNDNAIKGINFDDKSFTIDGNPLILTEDISPNKLDLQGTVVGIPPEDESLDFMEPIVLNWDQTYHSEYITQNKTYNKITSYGIIPFIYAWSVYSNDQWQMKWVAQNKGPRYFTVTTKDGKTIEYRVPNDNSIMFSDSTNAGSEWRIHKITDKNGNFMQFSYLSSRGQSVIKKIEYTGNANHSPLCSIEFEYDEKSVVKTTIYGENLYTEDKYLLKKITVNCGETTLKSYDLTYNLKKERNYLQEIKLTGLNEEKFNSTIVQWGNDNDVIAVEQVSTPEPYSLQTVNKSDRYWLSADVDGDGIDEVINIYPAVVQNPNQTFYLTKDYIQVFKPNVNNGLVTLIPEASYDIGTGLDYSRIKDEINPSVLIGDINGDGKKEFIIPKLDLTNGAKIKFIVAGGDIYERTLLYSTQLPLCSVSDINNDGIDEIIYIEKGKNSDPNSEYVYGEIGYTNSLQAKIWEVIAMHTGIGSSAIPSKILTGDFNNDGLTDLVVNQSASPFHENVGNDNITTTHYPVGFNSNTDQPYWCNYIVSENTIKQGDFDGDGVIDFIMNNAGSSTWQIVLGNQGQFTAIYENGGSSQNTVENEDCLITDFNNDGKSDVVLITKIKNSSNVYIKTIISWYASTGISFNIAKTFAIVDENYSFKKYNCVGDFNGDGRQEVLSYGSDIYNGGTKSDNVFISGAANTNYEANLVTKITDGMGNEKKIAYQPLTIAQTSDNKPFYTKGSSAVYPVRDLQLPLYCVSKIYTPNGNGEWSVSEYSYTEARTQLTGRGFLGFKTQTVSNDLLNRKTVATTNMDMNYYLPDKLTTETYITDNTPVSKSETTFTNTLVDGVFDSKPLRQENSDYLNDLSSATDYLSFDEYGNNTSVRTTQGDLITTRTVNFIQSGSLYPDKPETVTLTRTQNDETFTRTLKYEYDDTGNLTKEITDVGDPNQKTVEYKDKNEYGQYTKTEVSANGITRTSSVTMTASGRFMQSKTDVLGQTTTYQWDETKAQLQSETNRIGTTSFDYNGMGQLISTIYPDGNTAATVAQWAEDNSFGALYSTLSTTSGSAPVTVWYDALGRQIVQETYGLNGNISRVFTQYRTDGKIDRVSQPTFNTQPDAWDAVYEYDTYGRGKTVTTPLGTTTTAYSGKTVTVTTPDGTQETTVNSTGQTLTQKINGKTVTYAYFASGLLKSSTPEGGQPVEMEYDTQGNRTKLTDPDLGITSAYYNGWGELKWEKLTNNAEQGEITNQYNYNASTGLLETRVRNGETTSYLYDTNKRISSISIAGQHTQTLVYDDYDRVKTLTEVINNEKTLTKEVEYDAYGRVKKEIFPTGYYTENHYDTYGNLTEVTDRDNRSILKYTDANARGQITNLLKGNKETVYGYDAQKAMLTSIAASGVVDMAYLYDTKNNLYSRTDNLTAQSEVFSYDNQNRLTNWDMYKNGILSQQNGITYNASTGNMDTKTDLGGFSMNYGGNGKPHALTSINGVRSDFPADNLEVTYTDFRKMKTLAEGDKTYTLIYGVDDQRRKSVLNLPTSQGEEQRVRYYFGDYEEETDGLGNTRKIHYLSGGAIYVQTMYASSQSDTLYFAYTDNQGSVIALTDENGSVVRKYAYDPWGKRRNASNWTLADNGLNLVFARGYTGHEHLDAFGIINMNGRVYDPATAQFFSPDPFIQSPGDWLNYNRYSYVNNNPLRYTDPSGYQKIYLETPYFNDSYQHLMEFAGGGGTKGFMNDGHYGSISYNWDTKQYEYANGQAVDYSQVYYNYILPNGTNFTGQSASAVYEKMMDGFSIYHVTYKPGNINAYVFANGDLGTITVNSNGALNFSNPFAGYMPELNASEGGGSGINIWQDVSNALLVGAAANERTYLRTAQLVKEEKFAVAGWKTYSNLFRGNQYVSSVAVNEAKAAFNTVAKTASRVSTGLSLASMGITYANYMAGNVTYERMLVEEAINVIGLFGPWGAAISIGLGTIDAIWGDQIEAAIRGN